MYKYAFTTIRRRITSGAPSPSALPPPHPPGVRQAARRLELGGLGQQVRGEADQQVRQARAELQAAEMTIARLEAEADQAAQQLDVVQGQLVETRTGLLGAKM